MSRGRPTLQPLIEAAIRDLCGPPECTDPSWKSAAEWLKISQERVNADAMGRRLKRLVQSGRWEMTKASRDTDRLGVRVVTLYRPKVNK